MIKAISLWQPWASAMAEGLKHMETRSWPTDYRGELVIHAANRRPSLEEVGDQETYTKVMESMPFGCALCVVTLNACTSSERFCVGSPDRPGMILLSESERDLGNYEPGRFAWVTGNLRKLRKPVYLRGRQGLWTLTEEEERAVRAQL